MQIICNFFDAKCSNLLFSSLFCFLFVLIMMVIQLYQANILIW